MTFRFRDLRIAVRLGLLGIILLTATVIVGFGGWRGLTRTHDLQVRSAETAAQFAAAVDAARVAQVDFKKQVQEWKDLLLRGADGAAFKKYHDAFIAQSHAVDVDLATLKRQMSELGLDTHGVDNAMATHTDLGTQYLAAIQHYDAKDEKSVHVVDGLVAGIDRAPTTAIDGLVTGMKHEAEAASKRIDEQSSATFRQACVLLASVVLSAMVAGAILVMLLAYSITAPLGRAVKVAEAVAEGDLSTDIVAASRDETGKLLAALAMMNGQLRNVVSVIRTGSTEISASTQQIASGNQDLSRRTSEQAAALEETASSMQQFTHNVNANAMRAHEASRLAKSASDIAHQSGTAMSEAVGAMTQVQNVAGRITDITETMDRIATQTHILALNASVEAARAGEAGKGFNIVAAEVQALARSSRTASSEIRALIEESVTIIGSGTQIIGRAESMVGKLLGSVDDVTDTVESIATLSMEQANGIQQVNRAVRQMDEVTQNNAALVEEAAAAADTVQVRARALVQSVEFFKLDAKAVAYAGPMQSSQMQGHAVQQVQLKAA
ncbi:methyl-accepting chemotaxis protein [Dyella nitratireducens]|uniref:Methyl-accepting chemotaxis protein I n=1 Tax=Dyella nitratireducens TaxID=1849580 RepID=A0ABQ1G3E3_9GAMM|nr:methyl-accepting chemotaxis protein [Dyella nitratireducens]GGA35178.1 methyl-accepting chemotaxis protein I [Dyella nitratireducens]GLQ40963.1 methyl-accepting chemotaxis protein I [Dyella nitratireducens]